MKRTPALQDLSREHHDALKLARHGKLTALSGDAAAVAAFGAHVARSFENEMEPHFREEESDLLPFLTAAGESELVAALRQPDAATLQRFAELLAAHVRFEERTLFEAAQAHGFAPEDFSGCATPSRAAAPPPARPTAHPR